ncbi:MAG: hypothetical protein GX483_03900 [Actinomycetaceae bacterium]|nr:hypothetical protein [Actinomycetaceae bacterium]
MLRNLGEKYSPLYFLGSLGLGGMATFFFMIFMFITPHPETPIPVFESIVDTWAVSGAGMKALIVIAYIGQALFVIAHISLLVWNLREFSAFKQTEAYNKLRNSNAAVTLMAVPLTLAMAVNGMFVTGATMVPGLWGVIEYLLPPAVVVFAAIGLYAMSIYGHFLRNVLNGKFSFEANNGLNQLLAAFSFAMSGVGMAAGAAMSKNMATAALAFAGSMFFATISVMIIAVMLPLGFKSIMRYGLNPANSATLWLPVPIITLLAVTFIRNSHGAGFFEATRTGVSSDLSIMTAVVFTIALSLQVIFFLIGHTLMKDNGFYNDYVMTKKHQSPVAFTMVCPGVALGVLGFFGLHAGLVANGIVAMFSTVYFVLMAIIWTIQIATIALIVILLKNQIFRGNDDAVEQAEVSVETVLVNTEREKVEATA